MSDFQKISIKTFFDAVNDYCSDSEAKKRFSRLSKENQQDIIAGDYPDIVVYPEDYFTSTGFKI